MADPRFGTFIRSVRIEQGRLNNLAPLVLPSLDNGQPFRPIASGERQVRLLDGERSLDFSRARLHFTHGPALGRSAQRIRSNVREGYNTAELARDLWLARGFIGIRLRIIFRLSSEPVTR